MDFENEKVWTVVEEMPSYPGGEDSLFRLISLVRLSGAQEELQSRIRISFVIDSTGSVLNLCIRKTYYDYKLTNLETAALQTLSNMKKWNPGIQDGKKVAVRFEMPINIHMK